MDNPKTIPIPLPPCDEMDKGVDFSELLQDG